MTEIERCAMARSAVARVHEQCMGMDVSKRPKTAELRRKVLYAAEGVETSIRGLQEARVGREVRNRLNRVLEERVGQMLVMAQQLKRLKERVDTATKSTPVPESPTGAKKAPAPRIKVKGVSQNMTRQQKRALERAGERSE